MKICVIGNSHVASLKLGWDRVAAEFPGVELSFFAARGRRMSGLVAKNGKLVAGTESLAAAMAFVSGGVREVQAREYDAFILYGLLILPRLALGSSRALRRAATVDYLQSSVMHGVFAKMRSVTDKMVWIGPCPLAASYAERSDYPMLDYPNVIADLASMFDDPMTSILGQPLDTVLPSLTTDARFSEGALRLPDPEASGNKREHPEGETKHMNAEFGALWLQANLPRVIAA